MNQALIIWKPRNKSKADLEGFERSLRPVIAAAGSTQIYFRLSALNCSHSRTQKSASRIQGLEISGVTRLLELCRSRRVRSGRQRQGGGASL